MSESSCAACGGPIPPTSGGRVRLTCSERCKSRRKTQRAMDRYRSDPEYRRSFLEGKARLRRAAGVDPMHPGGETTCEWCGEVFPTRGAGSRMKKFCGASCQRKSWKANNRFLVEAWVPLVVIGTLPDGRSGPVAAKRSHRGNVLVFCPDCGLVMAAVAPGARRCSAWGGCGLALDI